MIGGDASLSESEADLPVEENDVLKNLADQQISIWGLIKTLLAPQTLPHIAMIVVLSSTFHVLASIDSLTTFAAMGFTSIAIGYAITAALSHTKIVQRMTKLPNKTSHVNEETASKASESGLDDGQKQQQNELSSSSHQATSQLATAQESANQSAKQSSSNESAPKQQSGKIKRIIFSFRICLFPLVMALLALLGMMTLFSQDGALGGFEEIIPLALALLFVVWSIVQGRSFSNWIAAISASKLPAAAAKNGSPKLQAISQAIAMILIAFIGVSFFHFLQGDEIIPLKIAIANLPFLLATIGLHIAAVSWSWKSRVAASRDAAMSAFTWKWTLMAQAFSTWHALTIWRQIDMAPNGSELLIEEVILMVFTVFMAIWTLTSRGINSKLPFFNKNSALHWGLSFGYAYAGSVAMLTVVLDDITNVMLAGHLLVIVTILWLQRSVLTKLVVNRDLSIEVKRIVESTSDRKSASQVQVEAGSTTEVQPTTESNSGVQTAAVASSEVQPTTVSESDVQSNANDTTDVQVAVVDENEMKLSKEDELSLVVNENEEQQSPKQNSSQNPSPEMEENSLQEPAINWEKPTETMSDEIEWSDEIIDLDD